MYVVDQNWTPTSIRVQYITCHVLHINQYKNLCALLCVLAMVPMSSIILSLYSTAADMIYDH